MDIQSSHQQGGWALDNTNYAFGGVSLSVGETHLLGQEVGTIKSEVQDIMLSGDLLKAGNELGLLGLEVYG